MLLGSVASGDERHPGRAVAPQCGFSGFPAPGEPGGMGTKMRWGYPCLPKAPLVPEAPPASAVRNLPADPVGHGKLDSAHEPSLVWGGRPIRGEGA